MINGDRKDLRSWEKLRYFPQCISGWRQGKAAPKIRLDKLYLQLVDEPTGTPARKLSNMLWASIDWDNLASQLGHDVHLFDIGCGRGAYGLKYKDFLGNNFGSYTGLDIYKHAAFPDEFQHVCDKAENISAHIGRQNLVVSQSALEHIEHDIDALKKAVAAQMASGKPFVQIHLLPAPASLFEYFWHGWRQYSAKNLSAMAQEISVAGDVTIRAIPLGGVRSFLVHFLNITVPSLLDRLLKRPYRDRTSEGSKTFVKINKAVLKDRQASARLPSFWALIICSDGVSYPDLFKNPPSQIR